MDGPDTLTHEKLHYWQLNRKIQVSDWQISTMLEMDEAFLQARSAKPQETEEKK